MNDFNTNTYEQNYLTFNQYLTKVFSTMVIGLLISALVAFGFSAAGLMDTGAGSMLMLVSIFACLGIGFFFSLRLQKMSLSTAWTCYIMYAILLGISLSSIFEVYSLGSIVWAFGASAILFACMAIIGHTTKMDLTKFGTLLFAGLIAIIITEVINMFIGSAGLESITLMLGVVIFLGLTAYDVQKLKVFYNNSTYDTELQGKITIYGAFQLYLDFINLFLRILQLFGSGKRRD